MTSHRVDTFDHSRKARVSTTRALRLHPSKRGFSLIELCCVILIVGVLAAIAIPKFSDSNALYRAEVAAKRVESDIHLAQDLARTLSLSHNAVFKPGATRYVVEPGSTDASPMHIAQSGARLSDLGAEPFKARVMKARFGSGSTLTFDAFGAPASGGHVVVYAGDWGALVRVGAGLGKTDITMFRVSHPPAVIVSEVGPMDTGTRTANPMPTTNLVERTVSLGGRVEITALEVATPGEGATAIVDTTGGR
jgi:prepilin-type N-terminal cleavage/methylation domain-containing protein